MLATFSDQESSSAQLWEVTVQALLCDVPGLKYGVPLVRSELRLRMLLLIFS